MSAQEKSGRATRTLRAIVPARHTDVLAALCSFVAGVGLAGAIITAADAQSRVPVMFGGDARYDACGSSGIVTGLNPRGDNFLAVRAGPDTSYALLDRLGPDTVITICDFTADRQWIGIVYSVAGEECNTGGNLARRQPYRGPCRSGWVSARFVRPLAG